MSKDLLSLIEDRMPEFSKGQKLIGKFIVNHYDKAAFMTASKLGTTVGVSESTVVRFASEVGYEGYPQLQMVLACAALGVALSLSRKPGKEGE